MSDHADSEASAHVARIAEHSFGFTRLRPGQESAVHHLLGGRDVLVCLPTGAGKSAVYQIAGVALGGLTVVVSPLIALQYDQVRAIEEDGRAPRAVAVNSSQTGAANDEAWRAAEDGDAEFLFLSPEQLATPTVLDRLTRLRVSLLAVDEAHCISSWGHDFRPAYLQLGEAREALGRPRTVALTATAAPPVREEILGRLGIPGAAVVAYGFDRPNIRLEVRRFSDDDEKRAALIEDAVAAAKPGLVYVATRRETERFNDELRSRGVRAAAYHAGLRVRERERAHEGFRSGELDVVVATSAFGMGIDKDDVRFVFHAEPSDSVDSYSQEIGRGGRDGRPAIARLYYRQADLGLRRFFASGVPDASDLAAVYAVIAAAPGRISRRRVAEGVGATTRGIAARVGALIDAGLVTASSRGLQTALDVSADAAAEAALERLRARERVELSRVDMMRSYAEAHGCRRRFLLGYFGEVLEAPCGNCDLCSSESEPDDGRVRHDGLDARDESVRDDEPFPPRSRVVHAEWGAGTVMSIEEDRLTVFFETEGYRVLSKEAVNERDLLERI
jgi:ATP-dependent DNA helicase RecQ